MSGYTSQIFSLCALMFVLAIGAPMWVVALAVFSMVLSLVALLIPEDWEWPWARGGRK